MHHVRCFFVFKISNLFGLLNKSLACVLLCFLSNVDEQLIYFRVFYRKPSGSKPVERWRNFNPYSTSGLHSYKIAERFGWLRKGEAMSPKSYGVYRSSIDGFGKAIWITKVPFNARSNRRRGGARLDSTSSENMVPE